MLAGLTALALMVAAPAGATPLDVHADYLDNGVIERPHSTDDLRAALHAAEGDVQYAGLATAITDALERRLLGRTAGAVDQPRTLVPTIAPTPAADAEVLPAPQGVQNTAGPPWPLIAMAALAVMLVLSGLGTSVYRRVGGPRPTATTRRARQP
jgi:hypothetical protein